MRKEGRQQGSDQPKGDRLELHDSEESPEETTETASVVELFPDHGLDLTA